MPLNSEQPGFSHHPYYRALFEANPALQLLLDPVTWRIVDANPAIARFYGYSRETLQQMSLAELTLLSPGELCPPQRLHYLADSRPLDLWHRLASGSICPVQLTANPIELDGQALLLATLVATSPRTPAAVPLLPGTPVGAAQAPTDDITRALHAVAERLRQTTNLLEVLQTTVTEVHRVLKADRVLVYRLDNLNRIGTVIAETCMPPLASLLGWQICETSVSGGLVIGTVQAMSDIHQSNLDPAFIELLQTFSVRSRLAMPLFQGEQLWGVLIVHQCFSEREWQPWEIDFLHSLELQLGIALALEKVSALKNDFLSSVSHELRTPLSGIKTSAELLDITLQKLAEQGMSPDLYHKAARYLDILQVQCNREIELVTDILTLQQLEAGTQPFISSQVQLQYWVPQVLDTFEDKIQHQQQTLNSSISPRLPAITTDLFMFDRVLGELMTNACKFTPPGGRITVTVEPTSLDEQTCSLFGQPSFQIRVVNTGIEISPAEQGKIFQPFYRIPTLDPWKHGGTGVGLALVKKLVSILGGQIWLEETPGATCFVVELPVASRPESGVTHRAL